MPEFKLLVTGATSPLGQALLPELVIRYGEVAATTRTVAGAVRIADVGAWPLIADFSRPSRWEFRAQRVIHLAGMGHAAPAAALVRHSGAQQLLAISSASATDSSHPRSEAVIAAESTLIALPVDVKIVRPTMIYGTSRDRFVSKLIKLCKVSPAVPKVLGGGVITPVYIDDVVQAIVEANESVAIPTVSQIGGPHALRIGTMIDDICAVLGRRRAPLTVSIDGLVRAANRQGPARSKLAHAIQVLANDRSVDPPSTFGYTYRPTTFRDSISRISDPTKCK